MNLRLYGGLGNQIFQVASALMLAERCKNRQIFYDDTSMGNYSASRKNELESFFDFSKLDITFVRKKSLIHSFRLARIFPYVGLLISDKNYLSALNKPCCAVSFIDGYFQDCLRSADFEVLIEKLKLCLLPYSVGVKNKNSCVIHVRGGDFVNLGWNSVASRDYYTYAIDFMLKNSCVTSFDIVTDDVGYARELLSSVSCAFNFVQGSMQSDFYSIGSYPNQILSSSTFAFWASALGLQTNSLVIAPKYWSPGRIRKVRLPGEVNL